MDSVWNFVQANPNLIIFLVIGLIGGWLAGMLLGGGGLLRNLVVGVIGAFVGGYLQQLIPALRLPLNLPPLADQIITATIGALVVTIVARIIAR
jgi:uncharacterized membrane protein YeaQ/YmgE (transglycosylase-associated protein family)